MPLRPCLLVFVCLCASFAIVPFNANAQDGKLELSALPLAFERNQGQVATPYQFFARRSSMEIFFLPDGLDIVVAAPKSTTSQLRVRWIDANPTALSGDHPLPGRSNYFRGSDPSRWLHDVPQFALIRYKHLYPGVDLVFHGHGNMLEHDFVLEPGADPSRISLHLDKPSHITRSGDLVVDLGVAKVHFLRPVAYQESGGSRKEVPAKFVVAPNGDIRFKLGAYDPTKTLVIDPVFGFSTYLDGSNADSITAVTTDPGGNVYVTGYTGSTDFPITNANNPLCSVCSDVSQTTEAFISKLDPSGHTLLYSTFLGGSTQGGPSGTFTYSIALDKNGNIFVAGVSSSHDFPHAGAVLPLNPPNLNTNYFFIASLKSDGSALNYSGLVGGAEGIFTNGNHGKMTVDVSGNAYLSGVTDDAHFQLTPGTIGPTPMGYPIDTAFVLKVDTTGKLIYSTLIPGNAPYTPGSPVYNNNFPASGIAVDASGQVTLAGTGGLGLPTTPGVLQPTFPNNPNSTGPISGYLLQLNATATKLNFATYLTGTDYVGGLVVDSSGNWYVAGITSETNLPIGPNSYQKNIIPNSLCTCDAGYIMKVAPLATSVSAATYLSGSGGANFRGIALDSNANVLVGGFAFSPDFPLKNPYLNAYQTSTFAAAMVLAELKSDLSALLFGSYLSSTSSLGGASFGALTFDSGDKAIVVGQTLARDFPTTSQSFQSTPPPPANPLTGYQHSFISKLDLATPAPSVCLAPASIDFGPILVATSSSLNLNITNCGNADLHLSSTTSSVASIVPSQTCLLVAAGATCSLQLTFTPADTSSVAGTLTLNDDAAISHQTVLLSGKGGTPQVFFPPSFSVNDLVVGTHAEYPLVFVNTGDGNWIVNKVAVTGDFSVDNHCTQPVTPSRLFGVTSSCFIGFIFSPTQPGLRTGTLTITDNAAGSPHVISLSGNALSFYTTPSIAWIIGIPTDAQFPTLQIRGNNFFPASQVLVNSTSRTTRYIGETYITADLNPSDLAQTGEISVTVSNPSPAGGISNAFTVTIYAAIRGINFLHTVYDPKSAYLYSTVAAQSPKYANQVVIIDPATTNIVSAWTVGNGPNQLAVSDDGQFLYVGLDGDKKVAQVSLPAGTVNFTAGLGNDLISHNPMVADAIRVLPGQPHSWAVTLCGVTFTPCGNGIAVFDDAVQRPTFVSQNQLQPDALTFVGQSAANLYGTTLFQLPSTFYKFAIGSNGISLSNTVTNFSGASPGGGTLDSDGTSIYVSNGQIIDPTTLAIKTNGFQPQSFSPAFKVDLPVSRVYFSGPVRPQFFPGYIYVIQAFSLPTQQPIGLIPMFESSSGQEMYRWGTNGLAIGSQTSLLLVRTSLTGTSIPPAEFFASQLMPANVQAGINDLVLTISGSGFASGDSVTANGTPLQIGAVSPTQITTTIPAALLSLPGDVQIAVMDTSNHVAYLALVVAPEPTSVGLSANVLTFAAQIVGTSSSSQGVTLSNMGTAPITVSGITTGGDFSQTNNCATVAPGGTCSISVVFLPSAAGNRAGALTVNDNDPTKSQTVALAGIGSDVQIGGSGSSGTTATVSAGQTASYALVVSPEGGFAGQVSFSCSNLPNYAACNFSPASTNLGNTSVSVMVTITTSQHQAAALRQNVTPLVTMAMASLAMFVLLPLRSLRRNGRDALVQLVVLALIFWPLGGCGGASSTPPPPPPAPLVTPSGTYTVNFIVSSAQISRSVALTLIVK